MNQTQSGYVDGHCHLADPRLKGRLDTMISMAIKSNIRQFIQAGIGPEDWQRQLELQKIYPQVLPCFGLHPYFVADRSQQECEAALDLLVKMLPYSIGLGELGLDFRPHIMQDSRDRQLDMMHLQLEIGQSTKKTMVFHFVRAFKEAQRMLELYWDSQMSAMVHSFNGSAKEAQSYLSLGLHISIGCSVLQTDNIKLHQAVSIIPMERLVLETDSPDQPPPGMSENQPSHLILVAEKVAAIKGLKSHEVLDSSSRNLRQLFQL